MTSITGHPAKQNYLLGALPDEEFTELVSYLQPVKVPHGGMLYQSGELMSHAYFPTSALVSLHYMTEEGATVETATVGNEGMVGVWLCLGGDSMPGTAVAENTGELWRLSGSLLKQEFRKGGNLSRVLLRYTQTLLTQMTLAVACNCLHSVEQRLSYWLLSNEDRSTSREIVITQEDLAGKLGVRREAVTLAMGSLQRAGMISNRRGHVSIVGRASLVAVACACYMRQNRERTNLLLDLRRFDHSRPRLTRAAEGAS